ncbi:hypothetical protein DACRYDRAFT_109252 [Dacryopinax primogenitus]|uniref:Uncharacterized protein n=1 Tax=Dacryopinax primogenitus (strain DJM 731) TaxID=1858805 RepID=M5FUD5_DACPD|nr:uncharacterized protein DACRYDRAFT_109252 [Dacryopinax primogenitus]EJT99828.1 hypothetical protein DACRYDRAFT_109252 [Dacryopinax primogenitus]
MYAPPETVRQEREEVEKEREMGSGMGKGKKGRRGKWHKKSPSVELEASLADLSISTSTWRAGHSRSPSAPASLLPPLPVAATTAPSEEVKDRWGLSVNAALGRMHSDGHTKKGPRAPIVVDFWEEAMDLERAPSRKGETKEEGTEVQPGLEREEAAPAPERERGDGGWRRPRPGKRALNPGWGRTSVHRNVGPRTDADGRETHRHGPSFPLYLVHGPFPPLRTPSNSPQLACCPRSKQ